MRIFIVEPEPYQLQQLARICRAHPACGAVDCFDSFFAAAAKLDELSPGLVLFSSSADGGEEAFIRVLRSCRARPLFAELSAASLPRGALPPDGACAFILKPYLDEQIQAVLDRAARC